MATAIAGLVLAGPGIIDLCLKYGFRLVELSQTLKSADEEIRKGTTMLNAIWLRTSQQLNFLKEIWDTLDLDHKAIHNDSLNTLRGEFSKALARIESFKDPTKPEGSRHLSPQQKAKFVWKKSDLDKLLRDLRMWQESYDPSWYLIIQIARSVILAHNQQSSTVVGDDEFRRATNFLAARNAASGPKMQLPEAGLVNATIKRIHQSSAKYVQRAGSEKWMIMETFQCEEGADMNLVHADVKSLAQKLSYEEPMLGLLVCKGYLLRTNPEGRKHFDILFMIPEEFVEPPETLRTLLMVRKEHALSDRLRLAKRLARSVSYIHALDFVHKNIRPDTILMFETSKPGLDHAFLTGFERFRLAAGRTLMEGDDAIEKNLYRHPSRQGIRPEEAYRMQHDIYSLGVCLLEVGLWQPFLSYGTNGNIVLQDLLRVDSGSTTSTTPDGPASMKLHLVALARTRLPSVLGLPYSKIVINCLTCLDKDNADFGNRKDFQDEDGIEIGVRYIEKILNELQALSI